MFHISTEELGYVEKDIELVRERGGVGEGLVKVGVTTLATLLAAYKQLQYQNNRGRKDIVRVTDTDQNPA